MSTATAYMIPAISNPNVIRAVGTWVDSPAEWVGLQIQEGSDSVSTKLTAKKARALGKALLELADQVEGRG